MKRTFSTHLKQACTVFVSVGLLSMLSIGIPFKLQAADTDGINLWHLSGMSILVSSKFSKLTSIMANGFWALNSAISVGLKSATQMIRRPVVRQEHLITVMVRQTIKLSSVCHTL